jgi:hypothetical protein
MLHIIGDDHEMEYSDEEEEWGLLVVEK